MAAWGRPESGAEATSSNTSWANLFILLRPRAKVKPPEKSCGGADSENESALARAELKHTPLQLATDAVPWGRQPLRLPDRHPNRRSELPPAQAEPRHMLRSPVAGHRHTRSPLPGVQVLALEVTTVPAPKARARIRMPLRPAAHAQAPPAMHPIRKQHFRRNPARSAPPAPISAFTVQCEESSLE